MYSAIGDVGWLQQTSKALHAACHKIPILGTLQATCTCELASSSAILQALPGTC